MNKFVLPGRVKEVAGSILTPINAGLKMVVLPVSQSGEVKSTTFEVLSHRYPKVKEDYRSTFVNQTLKLGDVFSTATSSECWVMQMVCLDKKDVLDTSALDKCIKKLLDTAKFEKASLHVSQSVLKDVPALDKALTTMAPDEGLHLYVYVDAHVAEPKKKNLKKSK